MSNMYQVVVSTWVLLIVILKCVSSTSHRDDRQVGIAAFDCNNTQIEVTTFDINHVKECTKPVNITTNTRRVRVQIIQRKDTDVLLVRRCKVIAQSLMWHCGMHSHSSIANYHLAPRPIELARDECSAVHMTGKLTLQGNTYEHIKRNGTTILESTLVGSVWGNGNCEGSSITIGGHTYKNVVMKVSYTITLQEQRHYYTTGTEELTAFGGVTCKLTDSVCYDHDVGTITWTAPLRECMKNKYESLYAGQADIITTSQLGPNDVYVRVAPSIDAKFQIFTPLLRYEPLCGLDGHSTPYHGLYVIEYRDQPPFPLTTPLTPNVDIIRYIETKHMTFAYGSSLSLLDIIQTISMNQCQSYRGTLLNRLHIIAATPSSANLLLNNRPGIYGRVAGEVVHIMQCPAVMVTLRRNMFCTSEIPVSYQGHDMYMDPRTRILSNSYTVTDCSILTPVMFRHGSSWVKMSPGFSPADVPNTLSPDMLDQFSFKQYTAYAQGGIYDPQDLQKVREFMMFSNRRDAMSANILNSLEGKMAPKYDLTQALHPTGWENLAKDRLRQMWGGFQRIGEVISGFLGVYFCFVILRTVLSIIIRCCNLYRLTGFSLSLLAALWSSATQFVLTQRLSHDNDGGPRRVWWKDWWSKQRKNPTDEEQAQSMPLNHLAENHAVADADKPPNQTSTTPESPSCSIAIAPVTTRLDAPAKQLYPTSFTLPPY